MKWHVVRTALAAFLLTLSGPFAARGQQPKKVEIVADARTGQQVVKGQLVVWLQPGAKEQALKPILERFGAKFEVVDRLPALNQVTIQTDHDRLHELRQRLANHPFVAAAALNALHRAAQMPAVKKPGFNDPVFTKPDDKPIDRDNWNLYRIKLPEAWEITKGGALVAVVDSGSKTDHEELAGKTADLFSFAPTPDQRDGVKSVFGPDGQPTQEEVRDHGTHVAVTATGRANNGVGTAGVAPESPLLPVQSLYYVPDPQGGATGTISGQTAEFIGGIQRAIDQGAAVINCSFGTYLPREQVARWQAAKTDEERAAVEEALMPAVQREMMAYAPVLDLANRRGVIIVVAAGNQDMPAHLYAMGLSQRAVVVGAIDSGDKRYQYSNHGPYTMVCAPGVNVYSGLAREMDGQGYYGYMTGTSMAAPHVTGVVALMKTIDPGLKHADVVDILASTGEPLATDKWVGPLVNAKAALEETKRRLEQGVPRQPEPPPLTPQPTVTPIQPELPPNPLTWIEQPDPWNNAYVQQIMQVWLSMAVATPPEGAQAGGVWVYTRYGQVININIDISITLQQPVWAGFQFRWLWENSMLLQSANMGSLYEFVVGTLRQGRFDPAPPRVPEQFRPRPTDPKPRQGGLPFDPTFRNTRWKGTNAKREVIEISFTKETVEIVRAGKTASYRFALNTALSPMTIDLFPMAGNAERLAGLIQVTGLGELLLRTDFTSKRPPTISRGDPLAFLLKRVDVEVTEPAATGDGVQLPILFRGTETLIRGLDHPATPKEKAAWGDDGMPTVHIYALSGDGKRVWVVLVKANEKELKDRVQLWSMNAAGGDAKQASFTWPADAGARLEHVLTNHDGSVAWLYTRVNAAGGAGGNAYLQTVTPGGTAKKVAYTADIKGVNVLLGCIDPRITTDGKSLFAITDLGLTRFDQDGHHHVVADRKQFTYNGKPLSDYFAGLSQLVLSGDGSHWAMAASFQGAATPKAPQAILVGSPKGVEQIVLDNKDGTFDNCVRLSMSADGKTLVYQRENQAKRLYPVYVRQDGVSKLVRSDLGHVRSALLAPDGRTLYAATSVAAFTEDLGTGRRNRVMTGAVPTRWDTWWKHEDIRFFHTSTDGKTLIAKPEYDFGLYVYRGGAEPTAEQPAILSVRQRYDGDTLKVTIEAKSAEKIGSVTVLPMKNGHLPAGDAVPRAKNPLWGVDYVSRIARPVEKRPGVYEIAIPVGPQHAQLDGTYSFRVVVANADKTQATFQDCPVLR